MEVRVIPLDGEDFFIPIDEAESLRAAGKLVHDGQFYRVAPPPKKPLTFAEWAKFAISLIALAAMGFVSLRRLSTVSTRLQTNCYISRSIPMWASSTESYSQPWPFTSTTSAGQRTNFPARCSRLRSEASPLKRIYYKGDLREQLRCLP